MTELEQIMSAADEYANSAMDDGELGFAEHSYHTQSLRAALMALIKSMMQDRERALAQTRMRQMGDLAR